MLTRTWRRWPATSNGVAERGAHAAGGHRRLRLVLDAGAEDGELVAAEARDQVAVAHGAAQPVRDLDQQPVAGLVAEAVVDDLEVVEVEEEDGDALAASAAPRSAARNAARSGRPVSASNPGAAWKTSADKTS